MNEEICCDELEAAERAGAIRSDDGEIQITDERGDVVLYDVRHCPFCAAYIGDLGV